MSGTLLVIVLIVAVAAFFISQRPSEFNVTRSASMDAPPETVFAQVNDFHKWEAWSPWAKLDPDARVSFEGAPAGTGAIMRWVGNNKIGEGSCTITESRPNDLIRMRLDFLKPFKGTSFSEFTFGPQGNGTMVTWSMSGENNFMAKAMSLVMNCEKMVGGQYEKGLASMKALVENRQIPLS